MKNNIIITIARQYGSGGREIGKRLSEKTGYDYYDVEILDKASQNSGLTKETIARYDEKLKDGWMNLSAGMSSLSGREYLSIPVKAVAAQFETIREIGKKGSAVIVGRCADYVLKDQDNVLTVFIYADMKYRIDRVAQRNRISPGEAEQRIRITDKNRAAYYNYYTDRNWGKSQNYHLSIDSGYFGIENSVVLLEACINNMENLSSRTRN